jgi:hypothetical protein
MKVMDIIPGLELHATPEGEPYLMTAAGRMPMTRAPRPLWAKIIESWQLKPEHDCLRARGDARWLAASWAAGLCK